MDEVDLKEFAARRRKISDEMLPGSALIIDSAHFATKSNDTTFPFRQDSSFHYLTGFPEEGAVFVLVKNDVGDVSTHLFCKPKDTTSEQWTGRIIGPKNAQADFGMDKAYSADTIDTKLPELLLGCKQLYHLREKSTAFNLQLNTWLQAAMRLARHVQPRPCVPKIKIDCTEALFQARLIKTPWELAKLREVAAISASAHIKLMQVTRAGMNERALAARLRYECTSHGCEDLAYDSIVAGGANAWVLHYTQNKASLKSGQLVLIDAAGQKEYYAADITRTFPVNGKFTSAQKAIYELVLTAQKKAIAAIKPGVTFGTIKALVIRELTQGLLKLKILKGQLETLIKNKAYAKYYPHGFGHWVGLDVHDPADTYQADSDDFTTELQPGMVLTVEPGLYFDADDTSVPKKWRGIGVRIEDDILVTAKGAENMTKAVPREVAEIEALMSVNKTPDLVTALYGGGLSTAAAERLFYGDTAQRKGYLLRHRPS